MPFNQRKQLRNRRGHKMGTVEVALQLQEDEQGYQPGVTRPIDVDIRRSCQDYCAFHEIRIRLHEVLSYSSKDGAIVLESTKLIKTDMKTNRKKKSKSGVIVLRNAPLEIPAKTRPDGKLEGFVRVKHVLEIKLISKGIGVENMSFRFPFAIGRPQPCKVMTDNHSCYHDEKVHSIRQTKSPRPQLLKFPKSEIEALFCDLSSFSTSSSIRSEVNDDVSS